MAVRQSDLIEFHSYHRVNRACGQSITFPQPFKSIVRFGVFVMHVIRRFLKDESAATAIEYGLIAAGIAVAIIPTITGLGTHLKNALSTISAALQ